MSISPPVFFHHAQLKATFVQDAAQALSDQRIDAAEQAWLDAALSAAPSPGAARVELLGVDDGSDPPALTGTLMISDPATPARRVFLLGPIFGLETFDNRAAADAMLHHRISKRGTTLEGSLVQGPAFAAQMNRYLQSRAGRLERIAQALAGLPTLGGQVTENGTVAGSAPAYRLALSQFWKTATAGSKHMHQLASKAFAEGFYQDLAAARLKPDSKQLLQVDPAWAAMHPTGLRFEKILVHLGGAWVELAGAFAYSHDNDAGMTLFFPDTGLHSLASNTGLNTYLDALAPPPGLPLQYVPQWRAARPRTYQLQQIEQSIFVDRIDSIVALQQLNLAFSLPRAGNDLPRAQVAVDDALDIRRLIDRRLANLDPTTRWARARSAPEMQPKPADPTFKPLVQGIDRLVWLASERDLMYRVSPNLGSVAHSLLQPALAVFDENLSPQTTLLRRAASAGEAPARDTNLVATLFQRISGFSTEAIHAEDWLQDIHQVKLPSLDPAAIEAVLSTAQQAFSARFAALLKGSDTLNLCLNRRWLNVPGVLQRNLEDGIRLEMALQTYFLTTPPALLARLKQVLDTPRALDRLAQSKPMVRVSGLQLNHLPGTPGVRLDLALMIDQPSSSDQAVLFWSPIEGLKGYASLQQLGDTVIANLSTGQNRNKWLALLPAGQYHVWRPLLEPGLSDSLNISAWEIADAPLREMQSTTRRHQQRNAETALQLAKEGHLLAGIFEPLVDNPRTHDPIADYFEEQSARFADLHTREVLPDWLNLASALDQNTFALLLHASLNNLKSQNSYLFDIPAMPAYTRKHLREQLEKDFPGEGLDPAAILITLTSFTAAPVPPGSLPSAIPAATTTVVHDLTQAAITHFSLNLGAVMTIARTDGKVVPAQLTPEYIRALIRTLDLGAKYQQLLAKELVPENKTFALRQQRFDAMLTSTLELGVLQRVLRDDWSRTALKYVNAILDMPDGLARRAEAGQEIIISRLQLLAAADLTPDAVSGMYLIGPSSSAEGPVVMVATYGVEDALRVYDTRQALLAALHSDTTLQTQILDRLPPKARQTYDNGGFIEPHLPWSVESSFEAPLVTPAPVQLSVAPITGNALQVLLQDNIAYLQASAKTQAVTTAVAQWNNFTELMSLGLEQATLFLPGRLGLLANLWQAKTWASTAIDSAAQNQWGKSLSELATALASLAGAKTAEEPVGSPAYTASHRAAAALRSTNALRSYEVRDISLASLKKDLALPIYRRGDTAYAAVEGRVYRVTQQGEQWSIFTGEQQTGPKIRLDAKRHWVLEWAGGLKGGGLAGSKFDAHDTEVENIDAEVDRRFTVAARGMVQIKAADRIKARQIRSAHLLALRYLQVCLRNLDADRRMGFIPLTSDVILQAVFGFPATPTVLTQRLKNMISDIYIDMLSPSMSPKSSARFVMGSHRRSDDIADAFVFRKDPLRRVFLADSFFSHVFEGDLTLEAQVSSFDPLAHFQATVLIHELSHLNNKTSDIAYLLSAAPFVDLISDQSAQARADVLNQQNRGLSMHTPRDHLFKVRDQGVLRDLTTKDGPGLAAVLRLTGTRSLEAARDVFYSDPIKRCDVLLANADTIAMLVTKLGRVPFHAPAS